MKEGNIDELVTQAEILIERRDPHALKLVKRIAAEAGKQKGERNAAQANYLLAYYQCVVANNYQKAIELCEAALASATASALADIDYKLFMTLGNAFRLKGDLYSAQLWYMKGLKHLEKAKKIGRTAKTFLASFYYNLGILFTNTELNDSGESYLQKAITLNEELGPGLKLSLCYSALANLLEERRDYTGAIKLMRKALELDTQLNNKFGIAISHANMGILYSHVKQPKKAIEHLTVAVSFFQKQKMHHEEALVKYNIGRAYYLVRDYARALKLLRETEKIFTKLKNRHELIKVYELLAVILEKNGNYKAALACHQQYVENLKDVFDTEKNNALTRARQEFEAEQREKEAVLLREKNEEIQIYAATLEVANNDLESLTYSVSHDLKAPLSMIKNINGMAPRDEAGHRDYIDKTCSTALASIDDILSFSKAINKRNLAGYEVQNINALVGEKVTELNALAKAQQQKIVFTQRAKNLTARVNKEAIGRVMTNLISNAIKFSKQDGTIKVTIAADDDSQLLIEVSDQGIGIPPELHEHIFKKFSAAQRTGQHGEKSTGLGLYISHSIITLHGGSIGFKSEVGKGTAFTVRLPRTVKVAS